jgi:hypothetical protein
MKLITLVVAIAVALSSTIAVAQTKSVEKIHRDKAAKVRLQPNNGNPNGNADGPTTLSGTGSSQFGGSAAGTSGRN